MKKILILILLILIQIKIPVFAHVTVKDIGDTIISQNQITKHIQVIEDSFISLQFLIKVKTLDPFISNNTNPQYKIPINQLYLNDGENEFQMQPNSETLLLSISGLQLWGYTKNYTCIIKNIGVLPPGTYSTKLQFQTQTALFNYNTVYNLSFTIPIKQEVSSITNPVNIKLTPDNVFETNTNILNVTSPQLLADPMGFTWLPNPMNMYAQNNAYGNMIAAQYGASLGDQVRAQAAAQQAAYPQPQQLQKINAEYAGDIDANQETESGRAFDKATDAMKNNDKAKDFSILENYTDPNDNKKCAEEYRTAVSNLGKSYLANIDSTGNSDRKVTAEEFVNYELGKLDANASNQHKTQTKQMALNAFNKIDQNGDGLADWKELAATIATFDTTTDSSQTQKAINDRTINVKDFSKWSALLRQQGTNAFDITVRNNYKQLFEQ